MASSGADTGTSVPENVPYQLFGSSTNFSGHGLRIAAREQCLQNPDLVEQLLPQIFDGMTAVELKTARKSLLSAALTCRTLRPSAVKLLWRRLDSFVPLLRLCPSFQVARSGHLDLCGAVQSDEWNVLDRHAAHVREIVYDPGHRYTPLSPLAQMRLALRKMPLFPNLLRFQCPPNDAGTAEILLFLSPALSSVEISSARKNSSDAFIELLCTDCPRINHLKLTNQLYPTTAHYKGFHQLRSLDLRKMSGLMTSAAFTQIAQLAALSSFTTDMIGWEEIDFDHLALGGSFKRLSHLEVRTNYVLSQLHLPHLIPFIDSTRLRSLVISAPWPLPRQSANLNGPDEFQPVRSAICTRWGATLETLELHGPRITAADFAPLACVGSLRNVKLDDVLTGALTAENFSDVLRGWPNLVSLSILTGTVDLGLLQCVEQHCPALTVLEVPFLLGTLPPLPETPPTSHGLSELVVVKQQGTTLGASHREIPSLARHLDLMFPRIKEIRSRENRDPAWAQVQLLVKMCQDVRRRTMAMGAALQEMGT
ncbi:hypothetical protein B0H15DRAFT_847402, partial [Mycena belliarum]